MEEGRPTLLTFCRILASNPPLATRTENGSARRQDHQVMSLLGVRVQQPLLQIVAEDVNGALPQLCTVKSTQVSQASGLQSRQSQQHNRQADTSTRENISRP